MERQSRARSIARRASYCALVVAMMGIGALASAVRATTVLDVATVPCDSVLQGVSNDEAPGTRDVASLSGAARGVALIVHGLNTRPERMDVLAQWLAERGVASTRVSLSGHRGSAEEYARVDRPRWLLDVMAGYCRARAKADAAKAPLYLVGYSLGGLLPLDLMASRTESDVRFDRAILLAPALTPRWYGRMALAFGWFPTMVIPSLNPEIYRANRGTPIAAYRALYDSVDAWTESKRVITMPTLVLVDPKDELVSPEGLRSDSVRGRFADYHVEMIARASKSRVPHHLFIDPDCAGAEIWKSMTEKIAKHLGIDTIQ